MLVLHMCVKSGVRQVSFITYIAFVVSTLNIILWSALLFPPLSIKSRILITFFSFIIAFIHFWIWFMIFIFSLNLRIRLFHFNYLLLYFHFFYFFNRFFFFNFWFLLIHITSKPLLKNRFFFLRRFSFTPTPAYLLLLYWRSLFHFCIITIIITLL